MKFRLLRVKGFPAFLLIVDDIMAYNASQLQTKSRIYANGIYFD